MLLLAVSDSMRPTEPAREKYFNVVIVSGVARGNSFIEFPVAVVIVTLTSIQQTFPPPTTLPLPCSFLRNTKSMPLLSFVTFSPLFSFQVRKDDHQAENLRTLERIIELILAVGKVCNG